MIGQVTLKTAHALTEDYGVTAVFAAVAPFFIKIALKSPSSPY